MIAQYVSYAMAAVLVAAVVIELRTGKIPNWLTLLPFVLFIILAASGADRTFLAWQLGLAAIVFLIGIALFMFAGFGAGAAKLMTGVALFVPWDRGWYALIVFVVALFASAFVIVNLRKLAGSESSSWNVLAKNVMPMSVPLATMGFAVLFVAP